MIHYGLVFNFESFLGLVKFLFNFLFNIRLQQALICMNKLCDNQLALTLLTV